VDDEVLWLDATEQARLIRQRVLSSRELVLAAIERVEAIDPLLNAVIHRRFEQALDEATQVPGSAAAEGPDGPFGGVPFLLKDLNADAAGQPAHHGSRALRGAGNVAAADSWLVARYRRAGFVFLGRTNTPELGLVAITEPTAYGPTRNPWDLSRSTGGSSGGSAAAVAAGLVPVASGGDGAGSIRIPASMCGLVGLKPSRGRITLGPDGDSSGLTVKHVLARSVRDVAGVLDATAGPGAGELAMAPPPRRSYVSELTQPPVGLRVGLLDHASKGLLHPDCADAVMHTARLLHDLGHHVEPAYPLAFDDAALREHFLLRWSVNALMGVAGLEKRLGRALSSDDVEPVTWALAEMARGKTAADYARASAAFSQTARLMGRWWEDYDVLLTPTVADPPPGIGERRPSADDPSGIDAQLMSLALFTFPFNVSGQPAISLPLHMNRNGLPIGSQLSAAYGREDLLVQLSAQLEEASPWANRRPSLSSGLGRAGPEAVEDTVRGTCVR
jgi:amidase